MATVESYSIMASECNTIVASECDTVLVDKRRENAKAFEDSREFLKIMLERIDRYKKYGPLPVPFFHGLELLRAFEIREGNFIPAKSVYKGCGIETDGSNLKGNMIRKNRISTNYNLCDLAEGGFDVFGNLLGDVVYLASYKPDVTDHRMFCLVSSAYVESLAPKKMEIEEKYAKQYKFANVYCYTSKGTFFWESSGKSSSSITKNFPIIKDGEEWFEDYSLEVGATEPYFRELFESSA
jgi:hypothetical protein